MVSQVEEAHAGLGANKTDSLQHGGRATRLLFLFLLSRCSSRVLIGGNREEHLLRRKKNDSLLLLRLVIPDSSCFKTITSSGPASQSSPLPTNRVFHRREGKKCSSNPLHSMISSPLSLSSLGTPGNHVEEGRWGGEGSQHFLRMIWGVIQGFGQKWGSWKV